MGTKKSPRARRPATTPEGRENQLISLAFDVAEKMLQSGNAPAQVITHFLKMGASREQLEQERLKRENLLLSAKVDALDGVKELKELFEKAISAMRSYSGRGDDDYDPN